MAKKKKSENVMDIMSFGGGNGSGGVTNHVIRGIVRVEKFRSVYECIGNMDIKDSTKPNFINIFKNFEDWCKIRHRICGKAMRGATREIILEYFDVLRKRGVTEVTIKGYLTALRSIYGYMELMYHKDGWYNIAYDIDIRISVDDYSKKGITKEQWVGLLRAMPSDSNSDKRRKLLMYMFFVSGARLSSLRGLRWNDIVIDRDVNAMCLDIGLKGRGDRRGQVLLPDDAKVLLLQYKDSYDRQYCYDRYGVRCQSFDDGWYIFGIMGRAYSSSGIRNFVTGELKKAGIYERYVVTTHSFRHGAAMHILEHTDIKTTQDFLHHVSPASTQVYVKRMERRKAKEKVGEVMGKSMGEVSKDMWDSLGV